ncbi:hypothetical protein MTO96_034712 [Rhipicephalus appendiculatus]
MDNYLRDQFIEGITSQHLRERLLLEGSSLSSSHAVLLAQQQSDRIGELYNIIHWTSAEQNKFKASNGHRLKRRDDSTAANSGTVEEIQG